MQEDYNIYKTINFTILEYIEETDNDKIEEREVYWIQKLNTFETDEGYNLTNGGKSNTKYAQSTKDRLKEIRPDGENNINSKLSNDEVIIIKNILKDFPNISQAVIAKIFNTTITVLSNISNDNTWATVNDIELRTDELKELYSSKSKECINLNNATRNNVRGENSTLAILTENEAREIKHLLMMGELEHDEISNMYNVKRNAITAINRNVNWKYVIVDGWEEYLLKKEEKLKNRLTEEKVIEIKKLIIENKLNQNEIGEMYNINPCTVSEIKNSRKWSRVTFSEWEEYISNKDNLVKGNKLLKNQVEEIKKLIREGNMKQYEIAEIYGVERTTISAIKNNHIWCDVAI